MTGETGAAATRIIDDYIAQLPDDQARALTDLRSKVAVAAPDAVEAVSYSMPAFKLGKRVLVYYAAFKDHLSLFPASGSVMDKLGAELQSYFTGRGTLQFTPDRPLPDDVILKIVAIRRAEIDAAGS
ncbi:MAG TPA: DUF1801 domain-containing protein [Candidatus Limnocylindrales bacterium]|jgi:uncharacterized protein YdhG (YjbR/CyaY superfamily)